MKLVLATVEEAVDFRADPEDIKNMVEEADLVDMAEVDLVVTIEEKETIGAVDKMLQ